MSPAILSVKYSLHLLLCIWTIIQISAQDVLWHFLPPSFPPRHVMRMHVRVIQTCLAHLRDMTMLMAFATLISPLLDKRFGFGNTYGARAFESFSHIVLKA